MTDKVQKIREGVEKLKSQLLRGACSSQIAMETRCKEEAYNEVLAILDTMQEEPVSEELNKVAKEYADNITDRIGCKLQLRRAVVYGANWQKEQDQSTIELAEDHAMLAGMNKMEEQMMEKAIDGEVITTSDYGWENIRVHKKEHHCGQKLKVIVIKED